MNISQEDTERLAEGDRHAFQRVFRAAYPKVYAFALGFVKNTADAEDIAQTVFIRLWTRRDLLRRVHDPDAYLYTVTRNAVLNHIAAQKAYTLDITAVRDLAAGDASAQSRMEALDLQLLIDMVVENMPPQRQTVYRLSREEGLSNDEIARRTGLQKKTVENHLNLALGEIRKILKIIILLLMGWG